MIQFLLNDQLTSIDSERADLTLLNYLRDNVALTGTKEGCASGDCGACTVVIAEANQSGLSSDTENPLSYKAINSCVTFLSALQGKQVITVEQLKTGKALHPVQQAMVDANATQCGFCTPGFVMSIFALYQQNEPVNRADVITALSGNLCRCTGYKPIIAAAITACQADRDLTDMQQRREVANQLNAININTENSTDNLCLPRTRQQLASFIKQYPDALLVAGSTDLALEHTQQLKPLKKLISLSYVDGLKRASQQNNTLSIGSACTLGDIQALMLEHFPSLHEIIERFASVPIRNQATLGGNIAGASPIGDMAPVLIALNASVILDNGASTRTVVLREFFTGYRQTQLSQGEWIHSIEIPLLKPNQHLVAYKISKRFEDDISAVCMALNLTLDQGVVTRLSTGFGGVAATPAFCADLEQEIVGKIWKKSECVDIGKQILTSAFTPIDDVRATAEYRIQMLENLWHRFWLETNAQDNAIATRVIQHA
ncbi:MAG: xanthine dehydrogenase small subunit [Glaciecola sp.]|jgi:xanthine dehydrogenase small subunit